MYVLHILSPLHCLEGQLVSQRVFPFSYPGTLLLMQSRDPQSKMKMYVDVMLGTEPVLNTRFFRTFIAGQHVVS